MTYDKDFKTNADDTIATHPGKHGDHPVGGMVGAAVGGVVGGVAAGAAQGAILGTAVGPVGTAAGAVVGGVVGALAGKAIAQDINPTTEDAYWSDNYKTRPYITSSEDYETYRPAYRYGVDSYSTYEGRAFDEIEPQLKTRWDTVRGTSSLDWDRARPAARDAYERLYTQRGSDI